MKVLKGIAILALLTILVACCSYYYGTMSDSSMKNWILAATVIWFGSQLIGHFFYRN